MHMSIPELKIVLCTSTIPLMNTQGYTLGFLL